MAEAEGLGTSSSSCPCDRYWRPSRESSVLHALARLPDRLASRRHSVCLGGNPCRGFRGCDRQGCCARLRAKKFTSLRAASSCSRRSSIRAAGACQGRPRERRHAGQHGTRYEERTDSTFFSSGPVSRVQSRVVRQCFSNRGNAIISLRTCKRALSGITVERCQNVRSLVDHDLSSSHRFNPP